MKVLITKFNDCDICRRNVFFVNGNEIRFVSKEADICKYCSDGSNFQQLRESDGLELLEMEKSSLIKNG